MWSIGRAEHGESEEEYKDIDYDPEYDQAPRHTQVDHSQAENDHNSKENDHESTADDHESTEDNHESTEDDHGLSRQTSFLSFIFIYYSWFMTYIHSVASKVVSTYLKS